MPDEATPDPDGSQRRAPGAAAPLVFCGAIRCDARAVSRLLCGLRAALVTRDVPHARDDSWELVLAEILNNVVEHACHGDDRYLIGYWLRFAVEGLVGHVSDRGSPMPGLSLPAGRLREPTGPTAGLPEGGFGWHLIRKLTVRLEYRRVDKENRVDFMLPAPAETPRST